MADDILKDIPLPADLPENWTSGQIVAPTGAEAGLDNQHGYNYLMKQVNNAQKALKALAAQREEDLARIRYWVSDDPTSPASFIGGTWEQIKDRFILAAGDTYAAGSTGGSPTHTHDVSGNAGIGIKQNTTAYDTTGAKLSEEFPIGLFSHTHEYDSLFDSSNAFYSSIQCVKTKGSANEQSNIPPYVATYVWRRIA